MRSNIPAELKQLRQWVAAGTDKRPINPSSGHYASVENPATWGTFEQATATGHPYVGFVLTANDPYTVIDLDNKHEKPATPEELAVFQRILDGFSTYIERSASGSGYHIVLRGHTQSLKRGNVEVYSRDRYMIFTGNVVRNEPINDCQALLDRMVGEMRPRAQAELDSADALQSDEELVEMASHAANADKFNGLCNGQWADLGYPSQSEADFALLSMFAFFSPDNAQVARLFWLSALGKRDKATPEYINRCLRKIRASQPKADVDISGLLKSMAPAPAPVPEPEPEEAPTEQDPPPVEEWAMQPPPGLIGEIAAYIYGSAIRPVPEVAMAASIALAAGIAGRAFNISGSGLNHYIVLLAKTGSGKDGAASGIDRLLSAVRRLVPMADQFIGPSMFASGQALIRVLDEKPSFISVLGEFGFTLRSMCEPRANGALVMLKRVLLDLYSKSGHGAVLRSNVYSDKEKNTKLIASPNVTILGESTPDTFFDGLDSTHIAEGLIPRFSIIEYTGPRPPRNPNCGFAPPDALVSRLGELVAMALTIAQNNSCVHVQVDAEAQAMMDALDREADKKINTCKSDIELQLWNRAHLKALKLAALVAVGCNPAAPIITAESASWAISFVKKDVTGVAERYRSGNVGTGDHRAEEEIRRVIKEYRDSTQHVRRGYGVSKELAAQPDIVPYSYLRRRLRTLSVFSQDRRGTVAALKSALQDLVDADILSEVKVQGQVRRSGEISKFYKKGAAW